MALVESRAISTPWVMWLTPRIRSNGSDSSTSTCLGAHFSSFSLHGPHPGAHYNRARRCGEPFFDAAIDRARRLVLRDGLPMRQKRRGRGSFSKGFLAPLLTSLVWGFYAKREGVAMRLVGV